MPRCHLPKDLQQLIIFALCIKYQQQIIINNNSNGAHNIFPALSINNNGAFKDFLSITPIIAVAMAEIIANLPTLQHTTRAAPADLPTVQPHYQLQLHATIGKCINITCATTENV